MTKVLNGFVIGLVVFVFCIVAVADARDKGIAIESIEKRNRIALVLGNEAYRESPLINPVNDAEDMYRTLRELGFSVVKKINADRMQMLTAMRQFGKQLNSESIALFYFSGHGIQVDGENYLVPVGSEVQCEDEVEDQCVKISSVLRKMKSAESKLNIIILDACRNNPINNKYRSFNRGLARVDAPLGSLIIYATAPGSVASDGAGRNGLFTSKLLSYLSSPGLSVTEMLMKVRVDVMKASDNRQIPWESSSLTEQFYFSPGNSLSNFNQQPKIISKTPLNDNTTLTAADYIDLAAKARGYSERITYLKAAISAEPENCDAHLELAQQYARKNRFVEAIEVLNDALIKHDLQIIHYELGRQYRIIDKYDLAIKHFRIAAREDNYIGKQATKMCRIIEQR